MSGDGPPRRPRRILAVDFGDARTGLAATDFTGSIQVPLEPLHGMDRPSCAKAIAALAKERETETVVVGVPFAPDGGLGKRGATTAEFINLLAKHCPCPVVSVDESHTTDEAHTRLKAGGMKAAQRRKLADSISALVILERYLASF